MTTSLKDSLTCVVCGVSGPEVGPCPHANSQFDGCNASVCSGCRPSHRGRSHTLRAALYIIAIMGGLLIALIYAASLGGSETDAEKGLAEEETQERRTGRHCLSAWDGNHNGFESLVRDRLHNPDSMETHSTVLWPLAGDGQNHVRIIMEFSSINVFGARQRHHAHGYINPESCESFLVSINSDAFR